MARNVEIKARVTDFDHQYQLARELARQQSTVIDHVDHFFNCASGRLKLRVLSQIEGELIFYDRSNQAGPKLSSYLISMTTEPEKLRDVLKAAYGVRTTVRKTRNYWMVGRTRIHLDQVESLGDFLELEVVLDGSEDVAVGVREAERLMKALGIFDEQLVESVYVDLLEAANFKTSDTSLV